MSRDLYIKAKTPINSLIADMFEGRVLADGGTFEAKNCLVNSLDLALFQQASLIITPNGRKSGKIYALKPFDGSGDLTVVRATTKTEVNSSGVIVDVPINVPSFDYTNGSCPSILVEPQRTNLLTNSDGNLATYITNSNVTDATIPINGFTNSIQFGNNSVARFAYKRNFTPTIGVQYTLSVFVQMDDNSLPVLGLNSSTGDFSLLINNSFGIINPKITKIGVTNLYRVSVTHTATGTNTVFGVVKYTTQSVKGFKITGMQLEVGSNATSYIPTVASAVTRNADIIYKTGISDLIGQTQGTIFIDLDWLGNLTLPSRLFQINNGTSSSDIFFNINATTGNTQLFVNNVAKPLGTILSINTIKKLAFVYTPSSLKVFINGTLDINISESVTFALLDRLNIGSSNIASDRVANMRVNNFMIFKTALTNEQCINLTSI